jgi:hypothetical protein
MPLLTFAFEPPAEAEDAEFKPYLIALCIRKPVWSYIDKFLSKADEFTGAGLELKYATNWQLRREINRIYMVKSHLEFSFGMDVRRLTPPHAIAHATAHSQTTYSDSHTTYSGPRTTQATPPDGFAWDVHAAAERMKEMVKMEGIHVAHSLRDREVLYMSDHPYVTTNKASELVTRFHAKMLKMYEKLNTLDEACESLHTLGLNLERSRHRIVSTDKP